MNQEGVNREKCNPQAQVIIMPSLKDLACALIVAKKTNVEVSTTAAWTNINHCITQIDNCHGCIITLYVCITHDLYCIPYFTKKGPERNYSDTHLAFGGFPDSTRLLNFLVPLNLCQSLLKISSVLTLLAIVLERNLQLLLLKFRHSFKQGIVQFLVQVIFLSQRQEVD